MDHAAFYSKPGKRISWLGGMQGWLVMHGGHGNIYETWPV